MMAGFRQRADHGWYDIYGRPLNWRELWILVRGWGQDDRYHVARSVTPDWEWEQLTNWFASHQLLALQGANWQRARGKDSDRPQRITPALLRGEIDETAGETSKSGVRSGRRRGKVAQVKSAADLSSVKERMAARRKANR